MASIQAICEQLQVYMLTLPNISSAPAQPVDHLSPGVVSICHPVTGHWTTEASGSKRVLHTIAIDVHTPQRDTSRDFLVLLPYVESVPNLLMAQLTADSWGGTIDTFGSIDYAFVALAVAGIQTHAIQFKIIDVKVRSSVT